MPVYVPVPMPESSFAYSMDENVDYEGSKNALAKPFSGMSTGTKYRLSKTLVNKSN
jgi:hypothetical protein